jgi:hypothetical protein
MQISPRHPPAKYHVVYFFHTSHQICVIFKYIIVLTPFIGAAYSNVQVSLMRSNGRSLEPTYQHVFPWQLLKMEAHCYLISIVLTLC